MEDRLSQPLWEQEDTPEAPGSQRSRLGAQNNGHHDVSTVRDPPLWLGKVTRPSKGLGQGRKHQQKRVEAPGTWTLRRSHPVPELPSSSLQGAGCGGVGPGEGAGSPLLPSPRGPRSGGRGCSSGLGSPKEMFSPVYFQPRPWRFNIQNRSRGTGGRPCRPVQGARPPTMERK